MIKVFAALLVLAVGISAYADEEFVGVGIVISQDKHKNIRIDEVLAGGPADQAGIKAGNFITLIDGKAVPKKLKEVSNSIRGQEGTTVTLTVSDLNGHTWTHSMIRKRIIYTDPCFMEGNVQLSGMSTDPTGTTPFALQGYIGNQFVNWYVTNGFINAPYKGEYLNLRYYGNGMQQTIQGFVHGVSVRWWGTNNSFFTYQQCIK